MAAYGVLTTAPGLEPVLAQQARGAGAGLEPSVVQAPGYLRARLPGPGALAGLLGSLTTAHRIGAELAHGQVDPQDPWEGLQGLVDDVAWPRWVAPGASFSLRSDRHGEHPYASPEVETRVGGMIHRALDRALEGPVRVDLEAPQAPLRLTLDEAGGVVLWLDLAGPAPLHRRGYRRVPHPAGMKPTLAAGLLAMMGYQGQGVLVDPMAGTGSVSIEAAWRAHGIPSTKLRDGSLACRHAPATGGELDGLARAKDPLPDDGTAPCQHPAVVAGDLHGPHLVGLRENTRTAGVAGCMTTYQGPVAEVHEHVEACTHLVANPPYGLRSSDPRQVERVHGHLAVQAQRLLEAEGRLGLMTPHLGMVERLGGDHGLQVERSLPVLHGRLPIHLIVLTPH